MSRSPAKGASSEIAIDTALKARGPSASESSNKGYDRPLFPDLDVCLQVSSSLENPVAKYGLRVNGQPRSCIEISRRRTEVMSFVCQASTRRATWREGGRGAARQQVRFNAC